MSALLSYSYNVAPNGKENEPSDPIPSGTITQYGGRTAPAGWLLCDGGNYLPATYPALYAVINNYYSAGGAGAGTNAAQVMSSSYSYTGNTISIAGNNIQVNFHINIGSTAFLTGAVATSGIDVNNVPFLVTGGAAVGALTNTATLTGTFLSPVTGTGAGTGVGGSGNISATRLSFQVPDMTGKVVRGRLGTGAGTAPYQIGQTGGADSVVLTAVNVPSHGHGLTSVNAGGFLAAGSTFGYGGTSNVISNNTAGVTRTDTNVINSSNTQVLASGGTPTAVATADPYVTTTSIIKT
jgi:microcystin-dependent protein